MKKIVTLLFVLLLLCACGNMDGSGNVTTSPAPDLSTPALPMPSIDVSASPLPDTQTGGAAGNASASPAPTSSAR